MPLGLVEKVKKEKRPGEVSPEEGSQFYQPEEVTRTYKNDEFFAQVLKQGQSPKSQGRRLAVTGELGAGKTTLLQKIAQWVAAETERDVAIWVSLADLQRRNVEKYLLQKWLKDALGAVRVTPEMEDALALLFKSGQVWLLLDGVDEMGSSNPLATVANQISGWVAEARVVVTCRQNVWDAGKNALEGFDVYRNLDFDYPEGVGQFIQRWFVRQPDSGERLLAELAQAGKERIRDTVRNPLRLALLCRAWQFRQGGLPETKAGLYGQFAEALYVWKQEAFPTTAKQRKDLNEALGRLALRGMEQSESRFRLREGLVTEVLGETDEPLCKLALDLGWLNLVGVAVENPDERVYAFYHPTFQEYFAALAVDDWGYFLHHVPDNPRLGTYRIFEKQWKEVILLWFGRENVEKEKKEAFIEKLINFDDGCGEWNYPKVDRGFYEYRAYFLAGAVLPEFKNSHVSDAIVSQIVQWGFGYFYPQNRSEWVTFFKPIKEEARGGFIETDRKKAITPLMQLVDETSDKSTILIGTNILVNIAGGNEQAIFHLIKLLDETFDESTRRGVIKCFTEIITTKSEVARGHDKAINRLIKLLDETSDESTRSSVANSLGNIAGGNEGAINRLIQLLDETSDESTRSNVAYSLRKAGGNEGAINRLIQLLDETSNESTRSSVANSLGNIAGGNKGGINRLILLLDETYDEFTRQRVAYSLGNIARGNEKAINRLIQLLDETSDDDTRRSVADSLGTIAERADSLGRRIAEGNEKAINRLIRLLDETSNESTRWIVAYSLGKIAMGNEGAMARLIQLLDETSDEFTQKRVAESLGEIAVWNKGAIYRLIQLLDETSDYDTRRSVTYSLRKAGGNEYDITRLIQRLILLLGETYDEYTHNRIADILRKRIWEHPPVGCIAPEPPILDESTRRRVIALSSKIGKESKGAIDRLIQLLDENNKLTRPIAANILSKIEVGVGVVVVGVGVVVERLIQLIDETSDESTQRMVADILGRIEAGHEGAIKRLILLLDKTSDESTRRVIANSLGKIAVGNKEAIKRLIQLLDETSDENTRRVFAYILGKIIVTNEQYCRLVAVLKHNLNENIYQNKFDLYEQCYQLLWQCTQNLTYTEFYVVWHQQETPITTLTRTPQSNLWQKLWQYLNRPIF